MSLTTKHIEAKINLQPFYWRYIIQILLKCNSDVNSLPLVQIIAWHRTGDKSFRIYDCLVDQSNNCLVGKHIYASLTLNDLKSIFWIMILHICRLHDNHLSIISVSLLTSLFCIILISSPRSAAYMRQWTVSASVQKRAWRLSSAKPWSKPMLGLLSIRTLGTNFNDILIKIQNFSFAKMHFKASLVKRWQFCPGEMR